MPGTGQSPPQVEEIRVPGSDQIKLGDITTEERSLLERTALTRESPASYGRGRALEFVIRKALAALEVEFSPYKAAEMGGRHWQPRTEARWQQRPLSRANPPVAPNIWVKEEDLSKLIAWERRFQVPVIIVHLFDQEGFAVTLETVNDFNQRLQADPGGAIRLQVTTGIFKKDQVYDRVDAQGARETKPVFIVTPAAAVKVGDVTDVRIEAQLGLSQSKKYVAHPIFKGGHINISEQFIALLSGLRRIGNRSPQI